MIIGGYITSPKYPVVHCYAMYRIFFYAGGKMKFLLLVILENKNILGIESERDIGMV